jgi:hypothetical protein
MRIYGATGAMGATAAPSARRASAGTFSLPQGEGNATTASATSVRMAGGIDALLALQGVDDATERRRRSVARGRQALDVLEELKMAVLAGTLDTTALGRLKAAAVGLNEPSGDANLDGVLAEIELRVEVELAKMDSKTAR